MSQYVRKPLVVEAIQTDAHDINIGGVKGHKGDWVVTADGSSSICPRGQFAKEYMTKEEWAVELKRLAGQTTASPADTMTRDATAKIETLGLTDMAVAALKRNNIVSVTQLAEYAKSNALTDLDGVGVTLADQITDALKVHPATA